VASWSVEELPDAVVSTLGLQLQASLDAVYAREHDRDVAAGRTITYAAPAPGLVEEGGDYYVGGASTILRWPAIEVAVPDLNMQNFDIALTEGDFTENLVIVAWDSHVDRSILYRKLARLATAIWDVLLVPHSMGTAQVETVRAAWRQNPETPPGEELESGCLLVFGLSSTRMNP
jgi:hypothetical protein